MSLALVCGRMTMSFDKQKRWDSKAYRNFVATLPCANCEIEDDTIVPHHLKHRYAPWSGGASYKASDIFTMPLCYSCHDKLHNGEREVTDWQAEFIFKTLDAATRAGVLGVL